MKKPKIIFKLNSNNLGKVYVGHKWLRDVTMIDIHGEPYDYTVTVEQFKRDNNGRFVVADSGIERKRTEYHFRGH